MIYRILPFLLTFIAKRISTSRKTKRATAERGTTTNRRPARGRRH